MAERPTLKPVVVAPSPQKPLQTYRNLQTNTLLPLKPPPSLYHVQQLHQKKQKIPPPHYRYPRRCCSCRRFCCLLLLSLLLVVFLLLAIASLAYLYYQPNIPSFHLESINDTSRFHVSTSNTPTTVDITVAASIVSWNPNEKIELTYSDGGEGRVYITDVNGGDIPLNDVKVDGFEQRAKSAAVVKFEAGAKGVVVDDDVAKSMRTRVKGKGLECKVEVDLKVGVRIGRMVSAKIPVRIFCGPASAAGLRSVAGGVVSKCHIYLFRVQWFNLS